MTQRGGSGHGKVGGGFGAAPSQAAPSFRASELELPLFQPRGATADDEGNDEEEQAISQRGLRCPGRSSDTSTVARELRLLAIDQDGDFEWEATARAKALLGLPFQAARVVGGWSEGWVARGFA